MVQQEEDGEKEELLGSSRLSKYICVCASGHERHKAHMGLNFTLLRGFLGLCL